MNDAADSTTSQGPGKASKEGLDHAILDNLLEGFQVVSPDFRYLYVNDAAVTYGRTTRERLLGRTMMESYPGIENTEMFASLRKCMQTRAPGQMESEFAFPDGAKGWFELRFEPVAEGVVILSINIDGRKKAESAPRRAARALAALSRCNRTLVRAVDERRFMEDVCRVVVEHGGYRMVSIGLKESKGGQGARFVASAGIDKGHADFAEAVWSDAERGANPAGRAIHSGQPAVTRFLATDPDCEPWRKEALARGFSSGLALPIREAGQVLGALMIYASEPDAFDAGERELLEEMALDLGYGITTLRARGARQRSEEALVTFSLRLESLTDVVQELSQARSVDAIVDVVRHAARALAGADGATFVLREGDQCHYVDEDAVAPLWKGKRFPMSTCISGWAMSNKQPAVIEDIYTDARIPYDAYRPTFVRSLVMVPIRRQDPIGAIGAYWARQYRASPEEVRVLQALADSTSVAMENVRVLQELEEGKNRIRAIYDHLPMATFLWRRQEDSFVLVDFNEAAVRATQGGIPAFLGKQAAELDHAPPGMEKDLMECLERRTAVRREVDSAVPGTTKPRRLVLTYGFIPPDMVILHAEEVTEARQTEEHLKVLQRLEAVGRLAGGVAHDFNNLLTVILSHAGFAADELREPDPVRTEIVEIQKAAERAASLTRQLLAFGRKQVLEPQVLSLNKVIGGVERMLRRLLGEDIEIEVHLSEELGSVRADPAQIEQVIMNLAVNARDAMPQGGRLTIETANTELDEEYAARQVGARPGSFVLLSVTDTGCGIASETKAHIFEPFFTTKEVGKGTGLGLSTVYGIVKQSGGNIWVYSEVGHGTVFKVYLPRVDAPPAEIRRQPGYMAATGKETVLIVEDEVAVCRLAERILRNAGYNVLSASSAGNALLLCEKHAGEIDLLLTDVVMPQMSGRELAERLVKRSPRLRVLYMSGYTDNAIVHHGVLDAGLRFIAKPFTAAELTRKVREVLDGMVTVSGANWPAIVDETK